MAYTIEFTVECLPEGWAIEGNASAIDEETDAQIEQEIRDQLEAGNEWAWCAVRVKATAYDAQGEQIAYGEDFLGGCSYASEADFLACGCYEDMRDIARDDCEQEIERIRAALAGAK